MTSPSSPASRYSSPAATAGARRAVEPAAPWIERFARVGFAAKAVLYTIIGVLALRAAFGNGGTTTGSKGALSTILRQEWGSIALVVIALGLFGYAAWRIAEAILDPERRGSDMKAIALRVSYVARGLIHAALGVQAVLLASGMGGGSSGEEAAESWTARALAAPMGRWLVAIAGLCIGGYGLYQLYRAWKAKLSRQLDLSRLSREAGSWLIKVCRIGIGARGVVFAVIGGFLVRAGLDRDANKAADTGEALSTIGQFGDWLLAFVAAGLIAYGVYEIVQARYRVIRPA